MEQGTIPVGDTQINGGTATTPVSHQTICQIPAANIVKGGIYEIVVRYALTGTVETQLNNIEFSLNGATVSTGGPTLTGAGFNEIKFYKKLDGINTCAFRCAVNATTGAIYTGQIFLTRIA